MAFTVHVAYDSYLFLYLLSFGSGEADADEEDQEGPRPEPSQPYQAGQPGWPRQQHPGWSWTSNSRQPRCHLGRFVPGQVSSQEAQACHLVPCRDAHQG